MNNASKITVPQAVANAIAHYVTLADSKTQAFTDILSLGYEAEKSELILRHFAHDFDELMEALICGYEVAEPTPEEKVAEYYAQYRDKYLEAETGEGDHYYAVRIGVRDTLDLLGIQIKGVNA
jgi:DNA integrity scanning protein DisA with diadenylate cyclase activity